MQSTSGSLGVLAAPSTIQPFDAPLVLVTVAPAVIAASRRGRLFYSFAFELTARD